MPPPAQIVGQMLELVDDEYQRNGALAAVAFTYLLAGQLSEVLAAAMQAVAAVHAAGLAAGASSSGSRDDDN